MNAKSSADHHGGVAQMVERSLSMREVPGSIPGISILLVGPFLLTLLRPEEVIVK